MALPPSFRSGIILVAGLAIGAIGGTLFHQSLPGAEGSPEERAAKLEVELKGARNRIAALEEANPSARRPSGRTVRDGLRDLGEDIRAGRPVTPDDVVRSFQPFIRNIAPLLERMRIREEKRIVESTTGQLARQYDLTPAQQESLRKWFEARSEDNARAWTALVSQEGVHSKDLMRAASEVRLDDGLDPFMANMLTGEKLTSFQTARMAERANRVQSDADARTQRIDNIVGLSDAQRDQVFGIMARQSRDYDPAMKLEGVTGEITNTTGDPQQAVMAVLTAEQREIHKAEMDRRRREAAEDLQAIGLTLPPDWDPATDENFR